MLRYTVRPIGDRTPFTGKQVPSPFKAGWTDTLDILEREYTALDGKHLVIEVDVEERHIRNDGMLRGDAKAASPAVRVAFDSRHGPLVYATDRFGTSWGSDMAPWQHNLRAIALALEALRKVDRYGVTRRGEQYTGWKALPSGIAVAQTMSREDAARFILGLCGNPETPTLERLLTDPGCATATYRLAARMAHPDRGGTTEAFQRLGVAHRILTGTVAR